MKKYIILCVACLSAFSLFAGIHANAGKYGFQFLQLPVGPVSIALGGRGVHNPANSAAWLLQPAVNSMDSGKNVAVTHNSWLADSAFNAAWYGSANRRSHSAIAIRNLSSGKIEKRDETGFLYGYYEPVDIAVTGNYARRITPSLYAGINAGVAYEKLDSESAMAISSDLGLCYLPPIQDNKVSLSLRNIGISSKMDKEQPKLPLSAELDLYQGISFKEQHLGIEASLIKAADTSLRYVLSMDLNLFSLLHLRAGYKFRHDAEDLSAGLGFEYKSFMIDYAYAPFKNDLGDVHSIGLRYNF